MHRNEKKKTNENLSTGRRIVRDVTYICTRCRCLGLRRRRDSDLCICIAPIDHSERVPVNERVRLDFSMRFA